MSDANKVVMRRFWEEVVNKGDLKLIDELAAPGLVYRGPGDREVRGREGLKELVALYRSAFPDLHSSIEDQVAEGDRVASRLTVRGTQKGDLEGVAPQGKAMTITQINISRFKGGKMLELWDVFDELAMMRQIGAITAPPNA